ncbi:heavy metal translocating P-type ATPase [Ampullimonas aquatilis]|uniref:heavy metal translocating P-type ATPase n=1 Tax=Ampullimonas aquatilis TaxID=1341549 RepID=UPI003C764238
MSSLFKTPDVPLATASKALINCYHCGASISAPQVVSAIVNGDSRAFCCMGCAAASQAVHRAIQVPIKEIDTAIISKLHPSNQIHHQASPSSALREQICFDVTGVTCSGCMSVIERSLTQLPGVQEVATNLAARTVNVEFLPQLNAPADLVAAIQSRGYGAAIAESHDAEAARKQEKRTALWRLFVALFAMMQVMMYAYPAYIAMEDDLAVDDAQLLRIASLVLTIPVMLFSARPFFTGAWRDLTLMRVGMDVPVALGILVAFFASTFATVTMHGDVYFDSITMFVAFLLGGRYIEMLARNRAQRDVELLSQDQHQLACRLPDFPNMQNQEAVESHALKVGDKLLVKMGEALVADGIVVQGSSEFDESLLTGESRPSVVEVGDKLLSGAVNLGQAIVMQVQAVGAATQFSTIKRLLLDAAGKRPAMVALADRYASVFLAAMVILAGLAGIYWGRADAEHGVQVMIAVLIITCPCALSLATPIAYTAAAGRLARMGILALKPGALETLAKVNHIVLDKTGTLTQGKPSLQQIIRLSGADPLNLDTHALLAIAAALEQQAVHPVAKALIQDAPKQPVLVVEQLQEVQGRGVEAYLPGIGKVRLGSAAFVAELAGLEMKDLINPAEDGQIEVWLGATNQPLAVFSLSDAVRPEAASVLQHLQSTGLHVSMATGDRVETARAIGQELGIQQVAAGLLPQQKMAHVAAMQQRGQTVAMVGDGINDGPVLAQADVSISFAHGATVAHCASDLVLMREDLDLLVQVHQLAKRTRRIVLENLSWAFLYNLVSVPLAAAGMISPAWAGIGMATSSLLVVLNSLRLLR